MDGRGRKGKRRVRCLLSWNCRSEEMERRCDSFRCQPAIKGLGLVRIVGMVQRYVGVSGFASQALVGKLAECINQFQRSYPLHFIQFNTARDEDLLALAFSV